MTVFDMGKNMDFKPDYDILGFDAGPFPDKIIATHILFDAKGKMTVTPCEITREEFLKNHLYLLEYVNGCVNQ